MNWDSKALQFIKHTSQRSNDIRGFLGQAIAYLGTLSGAFTAFQICIEDAYTARVADATPDYLNDIILSPEPIKQLMSDNNNDVIYWKDVAAQQNIFEDVLMAVPSAVFIPIDVQNTTCLIALGWTDNQSFDATFRSYIETVQVRLREIIDQTSFLTTLYTDRDRFSAIIASMPQAVVFIDNDNYTGWTNNKGAALLGIQPGQQELNVISVAMNQLRASLSNKDEVNAKAMEVISSPTGIDNWIWQVSEPATSTYHVSYRAIKGTGVNGVSWIFHQVA
ncbi:MAG: hypothetical protein EOP56_12825 [Sphingobacteriales bacterium]|nr:MAG: hypothetical protein EOP56_12825 [Sphingobacteriales bacterium]